MENEISHSGKIVEITPQQMVVEIVSESACSSCHASALCGMAEIKHKKIELPAQVGYSIGEEVWVNLKKTMGMKAVWLAYVLPLLVLIAGVLLFSALGMAELLCGLASLALVALYYLIIFLFRNKLKNEYTFYIKKK